MQVFDRFAVFSRLRMGNILIPSWGQIVVLVMLICSYSASGFFLQEIYEKGGRKFGFINLPPLGCFPGLRLIGASNGGKCFEEPSSLAESHNRALSRHLPVLKDQLQGFRYSLYDFNAFLRRRINHPTGYGNSIRLYTNCIEISTLINSCWLDIGIVRLPCLWSYSNM